MSASVRVDNPTIINNYLSSFSYSTELGKWGGGGAKIQADVKIGSTSKCRNAVIFVYIGNTYVLDMQMPPP